MASLSRAEIADLKARVRKLDAQYAALCKDEELGLPVEHSKAIVLREIRVISQLISDCEKEQARQQAAASRPQVAPRPPMASTRPPVVAPRPPSAASRPSVAERLSMAASRQQVAPPPLVAPRQLVADSPLEFMQDFIMAVLLMASIGVLRDFFNSVFKGKYLEVRGDGNCGPRAFLTALAARAGINLPIDPPGMCDWIDRLKLLMIQEINQMLSAGIIKVDDLTSIPENLTLLPKGATLNHYFALFLTDGYNITNFDFRVLASMFNLQIDVIRQDTNGIDDVQCFVRRGNEIDDGIAQHICILQQRGHFVPLIQVDESLSSGSIRCLRTARSIGFTG